MWPIQNIERRTPLQCANTLLLAPFPYVIGESQDRPPAEGRHLAVIFRPRALVLIDRLQRKPNGRQGSTRRSKTGYYSEPLEVPKQLLPEFTTSFLRQPARGHHSPARAQNNFETRQLSNMLCHDGTVCSADAWRTC